MSLRFSYSSDVLLRPLFKTGDSLLKLEYEIIREHGKEKHRSPSDIGESLVSFQCLHVSSVYTHEVVHNPTGVPK